VEEKSDQSSSYKGEFSDSEPEENIKFSNATKDQDSPKKEEKSFEVVRIRRMSQIEEKSQGSSSVSEQEKEEENTFKKEDKLVIDITTPIQDKQEQIISTIREKKLK